jgi:hypothetical protein
MAEALVLINAFEVPVAEAERFIAAWEKARDYLMSQPGYVDTALHQAGCRMRNCGRPVRSRCQHMSPIRRFR